MCDLNLQTPTQIHGHGPVRYTFTVSGSGLAMIDRFSAGAMCDAEGDI